MLRRPVGGGQLDAFLALHTRARPPLNMLGGFLQRCRVLRDHPMTGREFLRASCLANASCLGSTGENGSRKPWFSPAVAAALYAELLHGLGEAEAIHHTAIEPTMLALSDEDLVGAGGDVIAARGADVVDHGVQRHLGCRRAGA